MATTEEVTYGTVDVFRAHELKRLGMERPIQPMWHWSWLAAERIRIGTMPTPRDVENVVQGALL